MPTKPAATLTNGVHHTEVRVRFGDTDPYGIVYFVSYFRYCHRAIEEFLRACGLPPEETFKNVPEGFGLPIVEAFTRGKAVIASTGGAVPETVNGLSPCLDPLDVDAWTALLGEWIEHPEAYAAWEARIRSDFRPREWPGVAEQIMAAALAPA